MREPLARPRHEISIPNDYVCSCLVTCSGCANMATYSRKKVGKRSQNEEGEPIKKRQRKVMNKKIRKTLQSSLESINTSVIILEAVAWVKEEFTDSDTHLTSFVNGLCDAEQLHRELAEFHRDTFVALHRHVALTPVEGEVDSSCNLRETDSSPGLSLALLETRTGVDIGA